MRRFPAGARLILSRHARGGRQRDRDEVRRDLGLRDRGDQARRAADRRRARRRQARRRGALGAGQDDRRAGPGCPRDLTPPRRPRDGHAALDRRADLLRALRDGDPRPRPPGDLADGLAGGDRHRLLHTKARIIDVRADRIREALEQDRIVLVAGFQGVSTDSRDVTTLGRGGSDTTAVALRPRSAPRLRDLHRRRRRLQRRPAPRSRTPASCRMVSFEEMLEMASSGEGAAAALGRVRPEPRHPDPLPQLRRRGPRYPRRLRGRDHGTTARHSRDPLDRRGPRHADRRPRRARRRRPHLRRARGGQRQRRRDHPERARVATTARRPLLHGRARTTCRGRRGDRGARRWASGSRPTSGSARSRSSAPGCAAIRASPPRSSRRSASSGSTSR